MSNCKRELPNTGCGERINIFMCCNEGACDGLLLTTLSIAGHTKRAISLYVGTMNLTELSPRYTAVTEGVADLCERILRESCPDSSVTLIDLEAQFRKELFSSANIDTAYTPYAMLRLVADMAELPQKLIYLDTDVMLNGDIGELYDIELGKYHYAAARDYYGRIFINPRYVNSGVMLWNLKKMGEDGILARARELCRDKKMLLCDQTALNRSGARKKLLPDRFNEQHKNRKDTLIRHFSMRIRWFPFHTEKIKPWQPELMHSVLSEYRYDPLIERWKELKGELLPKYRGSCCRKEKTICRIT